MVKTSPRVNPKSVEQDDDGWTVIFAFDEGDFPVHLCMAKIASWAGASANEGEVRAAIFEHAPKLEVIARLMQQAGKKKLRL